MFEFLEFGLCNKYFPGSTLHIIISVFAVLLLGYLLGSLNFGVIISKVFYRDDIRNHGSGNAGASNMLRTYGKFAAAMTFLGDGIKTALAVLIGAIFLGHNPLYAGSYLGGLASIIGHCFPVYYKFKGGKGVTSALFMVLCTEPIIAGIMLIMFICIVAGSRYISVGSMMCAMIYPLFLYRITGIPGLHVLIAIFIALLIVYLHRANIMRLLNGKENKISFKSKKENK